MVRFLNEGNLLKIIFGCIAQWLERRSHEAEVPSSNLGTAIKINFYSLEHQKNSFFFLLNDLNNKVKPKETPSVPVRM